MFKYFIANAILLFIAVFCLTAAPPIADEWNMVPLLEKFSLAGVFVPYGDHIIPFPRLIIIGLARLTHWNLKAETLLSLVIYLFAFYLIYWQFKRQASSSLAANLFLGAVLSQMTLANSYNLISGWQLGIHSCSLLLVIAFIVLSNSRERSAAFVGALACFLVAVYSFASGMFGFLTGVLIAVYRKHTKMALALAFAFILVLISYLWGYEGLGPEVVKYNYGLMFPFALVLFVLAYFGQSVIIVPHNFQFAGLNLLLIFPVMTGVGLVGLLIWLALKRGKSLLGQNAFPYALIVYAALSALVTAYARLPIFGVGMSQGSRFHIIAGFFFVGVMWLLINALSELELKKARSWLMGLFIFVYLFGQIAGGYATINRYLAVQGAVPALRSFESASDEELAPLFIAGEDIRKFPRILKKLKLNVFYDPKPQ